MVFFCAKIDTVGRPAPLSPGLSEMDSVGSPAQLSLGLSEMDTVGRPAPLSQARVLLLGVYGLT